MFAGLDVRMGFCQCMPRGDAGPKLIKVDIEHIKLATTSTTAYSAAAVMSQLLLCHCSDKEFVPAFP